jgi:hypothetical protein
MHSNFLHEYNHVFQMRYCVIDETNAIIFTLTHHQINLIIMKITRR